MKALQVTMEVPLATKAHVQDMRKFGEMLEKFQTDLTAAGFKVEVRENVVNRPGRG